MRTTVLTFPYSRLFFFFVPPLAVPEIKVLWEAPSTAAVLGGTGAGSSGGGGWRELGPLEASPDPGAGYFECPDLFPLLAPSGGPTGLWVHKWSRAGLEGDWWQV